MKTFFKICFAVVMGTIGCPELNAQNSGNVTLRFVGNDVQLTGDSEDNAVLVSVMPAGNKAIVQVEGLWGTTVNSRTMVSRAVTNLDDMRVDFASGTNRIYIENYESQTTNGDIMINGSGTDFVSIENGFTRKIDINGANFVTCDSIELTDMCSIFATESDDTVLIDSWDIRGLRIETFDGHDVIEVEGDIWGDVEIVSGINSKFNAYNDSDDVLLTDLHCFDLTVNTGSGSDRIECKKANYWFGVQGIATFNGGDGWDILYLNEIFKRFNGARYRFFAIPDFNEEYEHVDVEYVFGELPDVIGPSVVGGW